jgi:NADP-dependent 3-hydroxy acid dehydrogenase YdfG
VAGRAVTDSARGAELHAQPHAHPKAGPLADRTAVVTGASRGIGAATARGLTLAGARVIGVARSAGVTSSHMIAVRCDLMEPGGVEHVVDAARREFGGAPDILVNNAGAFVVGRVEETPVATFADMMTLNLSVPFALVHAFLPGMRARGRGHIVTVGSIADHVALPGNGAYAATKFGVRGLHEVLRAELSGTGVRATLVSPAAVDTALWDALDPAIRGRFPSREAMLRPDDVAEAVVYAVTRPDRVSIDEIRLAAS